jgi:uncharacterized membrane protein YfcA
LEPVKTHKEWLGVKITRGYYQPTLPIPIVSYYSGSTITAGGSGVVPFPTSGLTVSGSAALTSTYTSTLTLAGVGSPAVSVAIPWHVPVIALALPPMGWIGAWLMRLIRARRRRRRSIAGRCVECGYDLRAGPEGGAELLQRCPECGTEPHSGQRSGVARRS